MNTTLVKNKLQATAAAETGEQYTLAQILGIWAGAALPMGLIRWVITPILIPLVDMNPGFLYFILITSGLVWQGIFAFIILSREVRPLTWEGLKERLWLYTPSNPRTGVRSNWLYLWSIPIIVFVNVGYETLGSLNELWLNAFPFLAPPAYMEIQNLAEPALGQWWLLIVIAVLIVFNYLLGEGLIFHGILLPKMNGAFGKWDVIANHLLFMLYHLHKIEAWPRILLINWIWPLAVKRFRSYWVAVIVHGSDAPFLIVVFLMAIMGLM